MCGRSSLTKTEKELEKRFNSTFYSDDLERYNPIPNYNVTPTTRMPVITNLQPDKFQLFRWGLVPFWTKDIKKIGATINAKIETLEEKPMFKNLVKGQRCIVPMDGFYEWKKLDAKETQPYYISLKDQNVFSVAGLWDSWKSPEGELLFSYTIITMAANEFMSNLHDRMPALLTPNMEKLWLEDNVSTTQLLDILHPYDSDQMKAHKVSRKIGNVRERGKELMEEVETENDEEPNLFNQKL